MPTSGATDAVSPEEIVVLGAAVTTLGATEAGGVPGPSFSEERLVVSVVLEAVPVVISRATDGSG